MLGKGIAGGEVGKWSEGGEGVAHTEKEVSVAEVPKVLGVVVQVPGGAGEDAASGDFEENGVDHAVLIVLGLLGQARNEAVSDEGEEKMLFVDVVQREHRAAVEQELGGLRLEAEIFQRDTEGRLGLCSEGGYGGKEEKKTGQATAENAVQCRDGAVGNRHGTRRVSVHIRSA